MYARVTTIVFGENDVVDAKALYRGVLPAIDELDGFEGMLVLSGMDDRTLLIITLWASADAMAAAEPVLESVKRAETAYRQVEAKESVRYAVAGRRLSR
jgi:heme-degrading monooxygenase HmoA